MWESGHTYELYLKETRILVQAWLGSHPFQTQINCVNSLLKIHQGLKAQSCHYIQQALDDVFSPLAALRSHPCHPSLHPSIYPFWTHWPWSESTSGPLPLLFYLPGMLFPHIAMWFTLSSDSGLCLTITFTEHLRKRAFFFIILYLLSCLTCFLNTWPTKYLFDVCQTSNDVWCFRWTSLMTPAIQETWVQSLGWKDSPGEGSGNPLQYSCLWNSMDRGAWWATVHGVSKESDMT